MLHKTYLHFEMLTVQEAKITNASFHIILLWPDLNYIKPLLKVFGTTELSLRNLAKASSTRTSFQLSTACFCLIFAETNLIFL